MQAISKLQMQEYYKCNTFLELFKLYLFNREQWKGREYALFQIIYTEDL